MFDGVLFDLDGTLWDATPAISLSWNRVLSRHPEVSRAPITVPEVRSTMGMLLPDIARKLFPGQPERLERMYGAMKTVLYPDTPVELHLWQTGPGQGAFRLVNAATGQAILDRGELDWQA